jgi:hypothetical protein
MTLASGKGWRGGLIDGRWRQRQGGGQVQRVREAVQGRSPAGVVAGGGAQQARQPADGVRGRVQQWSTASGPAGCGAGEAEHGAV